jgi:sugar/nucleoside kinase (ribokinase family)
MDILCLGQFTTDIVVKGIDELPEKGKSIFVDKIELYNGGCACNTAIDLANLGIYTGVIGKVGKDTFGDFLISLLTKHKIDVRGLKQDSESNTSSTVVLVSSDGERTFLHYSGTNAKLTIEDIDFNLIKETKILHVAAIYLLPALDGMPIAQILREAKDIGIITSLDTAWDAKGQWLEKIEPSLPFVDFFLPNIEEASMISGKDSPEEIVKFFLSYGVKVVGLKMGDKGCYIQSKDKRLYVPAFKVKAVDTTGAGDAFVAGFLTGILKGWDLEFIGLFANAVGACSVMETGASQGVKSLEETLEFIKVGGYNAQKRV